MTAKAASNTPPNIKIEVVTILLACFHQEEEPSRRLAANPLTRGRRAAGVNFSNLPNGCGRRYNKKQVER
jgi:hypothetical protein